MPRRRSFVVSGLLLIPLMMLFVGCGRKRSLEEIELEKRELPYLYLTAKSQREVTAPATAGIFVDQQTGELAFPAFVCNHPDCPGREGEDDYLFIHFDPLYKAEGDKVVVVDIPAGEDPQAYITERGGHLMPTCPKCLENRDLQAETPEEKQAYFNAVEPYTPPATKKRAAELEEEYQRRFKEEQKIRKEGYQ